MTHLRDERRRDRQAAYTVIELLIVALLTAAVVSFAAPMLTGYGSSVRTSAAISDIRRMELVIERFQIINDGALPDSLADVGEGGALDPWGNPYQYLNITTVRGRGQVRKDRNLVPINSDYDLYSSGPDGRSVGPLTARHSRDDIIRADNGNYIGVAEGY